MILFLKSHRLPFRVAASAAQLKAGNYRKPKITFQGLPISIENPRGTLREGVDPGGKAWATGMAHHYGYIRGTLGVDGDHFDCFVGPDPRAPIAYVITTRKAPDFSEPDEQKAMLGFSSEEAALAAFHQNYDDPRHFGECLAMPMAEFRAKVRATRANPVLLKAAPILLVRPRRSGGGVVY